VSCIEQRCPPAFSDPFVKPCANIAAGPHPNHHAHRIWHPWSSAPRPALTLRSPPTLVRPPLRRRRDPHGPALALQTAHEMGGRPAPARTERPRQQHTHELQNHRWRRPRLGRVARARGAGGARHTQLHRVPRGHILEPAVPYTTERAQGARAGGDVRCVASFLCACMC
jgi:hypothetical protein